VKELPLLILSTASTAVTSGELMRPDSEFWAYWLEFISASQAPNRFRNDYFPLPKTWWVTEGRAWTHTFLSSLLCWNTTKNSSQLFAAQVTALLSPRQRINTEF
jgi:hypothetical protein